LALISELGVEIIDQHTTSLTRYAGERMAREDCRVITPMDAAGPIVTIRSPLDNEATDRLVHHLAERRVSVVKHLDAAGAPYIRLSFHCYNTTEEIDRFVEEYRGFVN
jgi:selenocysteine lyase/cysteine desulfurase